MNDKNIILSDAVNSGEEFLAHHGTPGMKWGVRRYQNEDGSLTPEGRKRYGLNTKYSNVSDEDLRNAINNKRTQNEYVGLMTEGPRKKQKEIKALVTTTFDTAKKGTDLYDATKWQAERNYADRKIAENAENIKNASNASKEVKEQITNDANKNIQTYKNAKNAIEAKKKIADTALNKNVSNPVSDVVSKGLTRNELKEQTALAQRNMQELNPDQLKKTVDRLKLEKEFDELVNPPKPSRVERGREIIQTIGSLLGVALTAATLIKVFKDWKKVQQSDEDYEYLAHYRTPGSKNGVRRYQNEDGSLTPEGYRHYGIDPNGRQAADPREILARQRAQQQAQAREAKAQRRQAAYTQKFQQRQALREAKNQAAVQRIYDRQALKTQKEQMNAQNKAAAENRANVRKNVIKGIASVAFIGAALYTGRHFLQQRALDKQHIRDMDKLIETNRSTIEKAQLEAGNIRYQEDTKRMLGERAANTEDYRAATERIRFENNRNSNGSQVPPVQNPSRTPPTQESPKPAQEPPKPTQEAPKPAQEPPKPTQEASKQAQEPPKHVQEISARIDEESPHLSSEERTRQRSDIDAKIDNFEQPEKDERAQRVSEREARKFQRENNRRMAREEREENRRIAREERENARRQKEEAEKERRKRELDEEIDRDQEAHKPAQETPDFEILDPEPNTRDATAYPQLPEKGTPDVIYLDDDQVVDKTESGNDFMSKPETIRELEGRPVPQLESESARKARMQEEYERIFGDSDLPEDETGRAEEDHKQEALPKPEETRLLPEPKADDKDKGSTSEFDYDKFSDTIKIEEYEDERSTAAKQEKILVETRKKVKDLDDKISSTEYEMKRLRKELTDPELTDKDRSLIESEMDELRDKRKTLSRDRSRLQLNYDIQAADYDHRRKMIDGWRKSLPDEAFDSYGNIKDEYKERHGYSRRESKTTSTVQEQPSTTQPKSPQSQKTSKEDKPGIKSGETSSKKYDKAESRKKRLLDRAKRLRKGNATLLDIILGSPYYNGKMMHQDNEEEEDNVFDKSDN